MLYLKKYFTEGLIQFTILLSLIGVRVDVDTYLSSQLPPLREIIQGPSSAYTQTQFHNLRNTLDGYGIHPKSVDLDSFFTARRLLNQVRSLDRLRVPSTELNAWLVHRDPDAVVSASSLPSPITLDNGGLEDVSSPEGLAMRAGGGGGTMAPESGEESLGAVAPHGGQSQTDTELSKEDIDLIDILWHQDIDLGAGREVFNYSTRQKENEAEKRLTEEERVEGEETWYNGLNQAHAQVDGETGENIHEQLTSLGPQTSLSLQECLRLLEATFPFGEEPELSDAVNPDLRESSADGPSTSQGLPSPLLTQPQPSVDLEQQWQDIMAIMELQEMEVNQTADNSFLDANSGTDNSSTMESNSLGFDLSSPTPINQDVSLHQASLPSCSQDFPPFFGLELDTRAPLDSSQADQPTMLQLSSNNSTNINSSCSATNLTGLLFPSLFNATGNVSCSPAMPDPLNSLLEEAMLDEISLMDLAMEEGFSQAQVFQLEDELDSDSGLSLDGPASPSSSETSCTSSTTSSSSSTSVTFSEEGAVGYSTDSEASPELEEGAVGGYQPEYSKFCRMSYQDPSQFQHLPQLEDISHNHTYNLPVASNSELQEDEEGEEEEEEEKKPPSFLKPPQDFMDKQSSRDERRARAMKIPFSNEKIINLPVEEFNELLSKHQLSEAQLSLIRDIRRRGKNKMAAQNCRKRKLDTILNLEQSVDELRRSKTKLLKEKMEFLHTIRQMRQKVHNLYQEVFSQLRNEDGRPYSASEYSLQYGADGSVLVMPRRLAAEQARNTQKKQKDEKK